MGGIIIIIIIMSLLIVDRTQPHKKLQLHIYM